MNKRDENPAASRDGAELTGIEENLEQRDDGQAQDVADDALDLGSDLVEESERGGPTDPTRLVPEDVPDLVEKMNDMLRSGRIDNDAFAGEPMHDDEEDVLGRTDEEDDIADGLDYDDGE